MNFSNIRSVKWASTRLKRTNWFPLAPGTSISSRKKWKSRAKPKRICRPRRNDREKFVQVKQNERNPSANCPLNHRQRRCIKVFRTDLLPSMTHRSSLRLENAVPSASIPPTRSSRYSVLPAINSTDAAVSPRSRRVDFDNDPLVSPAFGARKTSHWRSVGAKVRHLPKLRHAEIDSSTTITLDTPSETNLLETDLSSSQRSLPRHAQTRSILRKQNSIASSVGSVDLNHRNQRNNLLTPASTIVDEVPLGTKSQRLFGGSECFAQIMNELEEQAL